MVSYPVHILRRIKGRLNLMSKVRPFLIAACLAGLALPGWAQSPGAPQGPGRPVAPVQSARVAAFHATNYEIRASLDAIGQVMNAQAKVDFAAQIPGRIVDVSSIKTCASIPSATFPASRLRTNATTTRA